MSKKEKDEISGVDTTGHEWDGIKELDNPLPKWWLYVMYGCIVWAIGYWILMPALPLWNSYTKGVLNYSDRVNVAKDVKTMQDLRAPDFAKLQATPIEQVKNNPELYAFAQEAGKSVFNDNCATCHGAGGQGAKGYPSLTDDVWLWDGTYEGIRTTLNYGIRSGHENARISQMPSFGVDGLLEAKQINDLTEYVMTLSNISGADKAMANKGAALYATNCASCHGATGIGDPLKGAPNLTDKEYLYGANRDAIYAQIHYGRNGVMPNWNNRFDDATISALTVYVHSLGGGK